MCIITNACERLLWSVHTRVHARGERRMQRWTRGVGVDRWSTCRPAAYVYMLTLSDPAWAALLHVRPAGSRQACTRKMIAQTLCSEPALPHASSNKRAEDLPRGDIGHWYDRACIARLASGPSDPCPDHGPHNFVVFLFFPSINAYVRTCSALLSTIYPPLQQQRTHRPTASLRSTRRLRLGWVGGRGLGRVGSGRRL